MDSENDSSQNVKLEKRRDMTDGQSIEEGLLVGLPEDSRSEVAAADALSGKMGLKHKSVALQAKDLSMSGYSKEQNRHLVQASCKWVISKSLLGLLMVAATVNDLFGWLSCWLIATEM